MRCLAISIPVLFLASLAPAVTLQMLSTDEIAQKSTDIVYARVIDSYGTLHGSMIYTHYRIQVKETWKGSGKFTEIMLPGGTANGYRQTFAGVPSLAAGRNYVMFLWAGPAGAPQLTGLTQGLYDIGTDKSGALMASRPMTTEQLLDANGKAVQDQAVSVQLRDLHRSVDAALVPRKAIK